VAKNSNSNILCTEKNPKMATDLSSDYMEEEVCLLTSIKNNGTIINTYMTGISHLEQYGLSPDLLKIHPTCGGRTMLLISFLGLLNVLTLLVKLILIKFF